MDLKLIKPTALSALSGLSGLTGLSFEKAVEEYKSAGGLAKVDSGILVYPDAARLEQQEKQAGDKLVVVNKQLTEWLNVKRELSSSLKDKAALLRDSLFWKHVFKLVGDSEYRKSFDAVKIPVGKIKEQRYRAILESFLERPEYRKNLTAAYSGEIGGKKDKIASSARENAEFKLDLVNAQIAKLEKEKSDLERKITVFSVLRSAMKTVETD